MAQEPITATGVPVSATGAPFAHWSCCAQQAGSITHPHQLAGAPGWLPALVPGTVASALQANGLWDIHAPRDLDAEDWWYWTTFDAPQHVAGSSCHLVFDGLATLAEVWLNGRRLLATDNMFRAYRVDVGLDLRPRNELVIGFRALSEDLKKKRPRPRWKTKLVNHQQLRWHRCSLLGRIPGWSPPVPAVGPWRAIRLETGRFAVSDVRLASRVDGADGVVTLHARVHAAAPIETARLRLGDCEVAADVREDAHGWLLHAVLRVPNPPLWWPHTHGEQPRVECSLQIDAGAGRHTVSCGKVGFRRLEVSETGGFAIEVNGVPIYCRGACWTVSDIMTAGGSEESVARDLRLAREAGVNMLRIGGTMLYESDHFYRLCDELGILVWQDFMFANMDYPVDDPAFAANIEAEAKYQLGRLSAHPCIAVYCGNSEVEQQAAMLGAQREFWRNRWFASRLPELCAEYSPGSVYVPSSPSGGVLPFHVRDGVAHYYGVGAYLRSPQDVRRADVAFTSECLAFANIPGPEAVNALTGGGAPVVHHPLWKQRVPRDSGAGWDFDDVRDFYLQQFFAVDPVRLRCFDMLRYLQLSRVVSGEMMAQVFAEWRSGHSRNRGGLVWFFKDLWPAAGWGIVDSLGLPKAAYYYLRRSWRARQITMTDEGLDGLHLHVTNETAEPLHGSVELLLLRDEHVEVVRKEVPCQLLPRARQTFASAAILDGFFDVTYSYRFGPPQHQVAVATLFDDQRRVLSEACYFVTAREPAFLPAVQLDVAAQPIGAGCYQVALHSDHFLHSVSFEAKGFLPDDNYFHLPPSRHKLVRFRPIEDQATKFRASLEALNLKNPIIITAQPTCSTS
jgi:beta-mannosidase